MITTALYHASLGRTAHRRMTHRDHHVEGYQLSTSAPRLIVGLVIKPTLRFVLQIPLSTSATTAAFSSWFMCPRGPNGLHFKRPHPSAPPHHMLLHDVPHVGGAHFFTTTNMFTHTNTSNTSTEQRAHRKSSVVDVCVVTLCRLCVLCVIDVCCSMC